MSEGRTFRQKVTAAVFLVSLGPIAVAQRDLRRRPAEQIRGPRLAWRIASTNAVAAVLYLRVGRRTSER